MWNVSFSLDCKRLCCNIALCCLCAAVSTAANIAVNLFHLPAPLYWTTLLLLAAGVAVRWSRYGTPLEGSLGVAAAFLLLQIPVRILHMLPYPEIPGTEMMWAFPFAFVELWLMLECVGFLLHKALRIGKRVHPAL